MPKSAIIAALSWWRSMRSLLITAILMAVAGPAAAEVYLTKEQALDVALPKDCERRYDPKDISEQLTEKLEEQSLLGEELKQAHFFVCERSGKPLGYALIDSEIGKHLPITYVVGLSADGKITRVEMMVFREVRGWEARERKFLQQFEGKDLHDEMRLGRQISNATGATLSAAALTKGVKRALFLWQNFYGSKIS
jgi:Na+-translocating ferredoxin:NAD+ oxidoreductase RnfG subunit